MRLYEYGGNNARALEMGGLTLYFSYETLIAFDHRRTGLVIRENDWGPTTGKHLNAIDDDKSRRIPGNVFMELWEDFAIRAGISPQASSFEFAVALEE